MPIRSTSLRPDAHRQTDTHGRDTRPDQDSSVDPTGLDTGRKRRSSLLSLAGPLLWVMVTAIACQNASLSNPFGSSEKATTTRTSVPVSAPPGSQEESLPGNFAQLMAQAKAQEARNATIKALQLYRQALAAAPADLPAEERKALEQSISRLAFLLGVDAVPDNGKSQGEGGEVSATAPGSEQVVKARALYAQAQEKETQGLTAEAMALYTQIRTVITEKDDSPLYWNAWQKAADLQPDAPSSGLKGALPPSRGPVPAPSANKEESQDDESDGEVPNDGSVVSGNPSRDGEPGPRNEKLGRARALYVKAMSSSRTGDSNAARSALTEILSSITVEQDPELYRAAGQKLAELQP